jgi:16S rRNA (cytosine967-C5)-methyltransferase
VDQAVTAVRKGAPASAGFVNAVLRRFLRERAAQVAQAEPAPRGRWNHPAWWVEQVRPTGPTTGRRSWARPGCARRWPAGQRPAQQVPDYLARLAQAGLSGQPVAGPGWEQAIVLDAPVPVERLPGFAEGWVSVQDLAAQRAAPLLLGEGLPAGARVLDACAAPGGKTAHLLKLADLDLLALDADPARLARVGEGLRAWACGPAPRPPTPVRWSWWDGQPFDAILLDAPCSASGIVRRHPDIAWLRRPRTSALAASRPSCWTRCGRCSSRAGGCSTPPVRSSRPRGRSRSTRFCNAMACHRPARPGLPVICCRCRTIGRRVRRRPCGPCGRFSTRCPP